MARHYGCSRKEQYKDRKRAHDVNLQGKTQDETKNNKGRSTAVPVHPSIVYAWQCRCPLKVQTAFRAGSVQDKDATPNQNAQRVACTYRLPALLVPVIWANRFSQD
jgi:hypothetical protein